MPERVLRALRSQPWAILPEWLAAMEEIAARAVVAGNLEALRGSGHEHRYDAALAAMGQRLDGTRRATFRNGVAAVPVMGPIFPRANLFTEMSGATSLDVLAADLRAIAASEAVEKVLLVVDSPGGAVTGVNEFAGILASFDKPVVAHVSGMGASAAYWLASQATEVVIDTTGLVGSIGVVMSVSAQEAPGADGYRNIDIVSSNAVNKRPDFLTEEGRAVVRAELDAIEDVFISAVAKGRGTTRATVLRDFGQGGVKVGKAAVDAGMADRVDTLEGTFSRLSRRVSGSSPRRRRAAAERDLDLMRRRGA